MHGDAWSSEDKQQNGDVDNAGGVPGRPKDTRGVPQPSTFQVKSLSIPNMGN